MSLLSRNKIAQTVIIISLTAIVGAGCTMSAELSSAPGPAVAPAAYMGTFDNNQQNTEGVPFQLWNIFTHDQKASANIGKNKQVTVVSSSKDGFTAIHSVAGRELERRNIPWTFRNGSYYFCQPDIEWAAPWPLIVVGFESWRMDLVGNDILTLYRYSQGTSLPLPFGADGHDVHEFSRLKAE